MKTPGHSSHDWDSLSHLEPDLQGILADVRACHPPTTMPGYWETWRGFEMRLEAAFITSTTLPETEVAFLVAFEALRQAYWQSAVQTFRGDHEL